MATKKKQPDAEAPALLELSDATGVSVARAIVWAAEHINQAGVKLKLATDELGSSGTMAFAYWQYGRKHRTELLVQLVPKALSIIDKNRTPEADADVAAAEKATIADLEELLEGAIAEAAL